LWNSQNDRCQDTEKFFKYQQQHRAKVGLYLLLSTTTPLIGLGPD
jgi:hypothetical protein